MFVSSSSTGDPASFGPSTCCYDFPASIIEREVVLGGRLRARRSSLGRNSRKFLQGKGIHPPRPLHNPTSPNPPLQHLSPKLPNRPTAAAADKEQRGSQKTPPFLNPSICAAPPAGLITSLVGKEPSSSRPEKMCPLRVILIFLSATIAGFFLIRGLNAEPDQFDADADDQASSDSGSPRAPLPLHSKVGSAVKTRFWTMVDMASGRYLWRTLVAQPAKSESEKAR